MLFFLAILIGLSSFSQSIRVHNPVVIKQNDTYYLYCTGKSISCFSSKDLKNWENEPAVFSEKPEWTDDVVPDFKNHIWAPDISFHNDTYYLYYSVSAFGKNTSSIGVATNTTLNSNDRNLYSYLNPSRENTTLKINGEFVSTSEKDGYITIMREWKKNDSIELNFPMEVKEVVANEKVEENNGKAALEYGPLVYAVEEVDNKETFDAIVISPNETFEIKKNDLLGGVNTIQNNSLKAIHNGENQYRDVVA